MRKINNDLTITNVNISIYQGLNCAVVEFLYLDEYKAKGFYFERSDSYYKLETEYLDDSTHNALSAEIESNEKEITEYLVTVFEEQLEDYHV